MRLAAVVVSYNTRELLRRCLASLGEADEVVVVDNASDDGSAEMVERDFPSVRLLRNARNLEFGAANNQGMSAVGADACLLLNSDAYAEPGAVARLREALATPGVVACGGLLFDPATAKTQESACGPLTLWAVFCEQTGLEKFFPSSRWFSPYWQSGRLRRGGDGPHEVEQVMGACLAMRPLERFDERFFLYCEDTELCRRLRRHGRILYVPSARFGHELGASSSADRWRSVARYNRGKELYFEIHHGRAAALACLLLDRGGALFRLAAHAVLGAVRRDFGAARLWWRVLWCRASGPERP